MTHNEYDILDREILCKPCFSDTSCDQPIGWTQLDGTCSPHKIPGTPKGQIVHKSATIFCGKFGVPWYIYRCNISNLPYMYILYSGKRTL